MDLPFNVLDGIVEHTAKHDLPALAQVNRCFRQKVNSQLYRQIMVVDCSSVHQLDVKSRYTLVPVNRLAQLAQCLNAATFQCMRRLVIHSQSNLDQLNYDPLYAAFSRCWNAVPGHPLRVFNFDINNLRRFQSFNHYLASRSVHYIENNDDDRLELHAGNYKVNNLHNWIVFDPAEFSFLPCNPNLHELDLCIDRSMFALQSSSFSLATVSNLSRLHRLYLNSPQSGQFLLLVKQQHPSFTLPNLSSLSITASHNFRYPHVDFATYTQIINLNHLLDLELKVNCTHPHCQCIPQFFADWFAHNRTHNLSINLRKLVIINYKSVNSPHNLTQLNSLVENYIFVPELESLQEVIININDFTNVGNTTTTTTIPDASLVNVMQNCSNLPHLSKLIIPDFFYRWLKNIPRLMTTLSNNQHHRNYFDCVINSCQCPSCCQTRTMFKLCAREGYDKNHSYSLFMDSPCLTSSLRNDDKANLSFLNFVISQFKHEFVYLNQNLFSIASLLNLNDKPMVKNEALQPYLQLFMHGAVGDVVKLFRVQLKSLQEINLGGVAVNF